LRPEQKISRAGTNGKTVQLRKGAEITTAVMGRVFGAANAVSKVPKKVNRKGIVLPH